MVQATRGAFCPPLRTTPHPICPAPHICPPQALDMRKDEAIERTFKGVAKHFRDVFAELVPGVCVGGYMWWGDYSVEG